VGGCCWRCKPAADARMHRTARQVARAAAVGACRTRAQMCCAVATPGLPGLCGPSLRTVRRLQCTFVDILIMQWR
jgi:hypothetical protein